MTQRFPVAILGLIFLLNFSQASAHEGMWIPSTLSKLVVGNMQDAGLKLSAEEIYSINSSSLKDAMVHFGGGCTASVISEQGLILTNHHCGFSQIQYHSSVENDYLRDGFWAMGRNEELQNPNLTATFVIRIEDVTLAVMAAADGLDGADRAAAIARTSAELEKKAVEGKVYEAEVKPFFYGNAFYMIITETYRDIRLVGAPPSSIGKFGGDTDNWEWPRHTGDFSLFRIYASADNKPADYSENNRPYKPKKSLSVNMDGLKDGDFTMVFGFPGTTEQFLSSDAVSYITEVQNPAQIAMRKASLSVIDRAMESSDGLRIQYAAKQSRISNAYKKWIGQNLGLERFSAEEKKRKQEEKFVQAARSRKGYEGTAQIISEFEQLYNDATQYRLARTYLIEFFYYGPEVLRFSTNFNNVVQHYDSLEKNGLLKAEVEKLHRVMDSFYKNYDGKVDQNIFKAQLPVFMEGSPDILQSATLKKFATSNTGGLNNPGLVAKSVYDRSIFDNKGELTALLGKSGKRISKELSKDPIYLMADELLNNYNDKVRPGYANFQATEDAMMAIYVRATMAIFPDEIYWPDANSTLRLTFGKMEGSKPMDGMAYTPFTTLDGVVQKYIPGDKEFDLPKRLIDLHKDKDYGPYATNGELRVCFLGSNHTTGGNSGSPALDDRGQLVGLNFDRTWESTMSDIMFNGTICRNIMVDVKYILFIIDKFANAGHLVREMNLVSNKAANKESSEKIMEVN